METVGFISFRRLSCENGNFFFVSAIGHIRVWRLIFKRLEFCMWAFYRNLALNSEDTKYSGTPASSMDGFLRFTLLFLDHTIYCKLTVEVELLKHF
ncbi:hypothetical protein RhiirA4_486585 [Rhizophagus irregularis]|uniref:Uncharacterized protein n=1 Tax=Rhizophagus irregularis TaxID=588596 RepID=A0A2I1HRN2_9GLOM|nr:hypothetical protein RhiirA4_486579 [Rhizophagus irregularis]PKY61512.1 hypothetical protein RhiirA4_486585 [Rhizophagus irregularis]